MINTDASKIILVIDDSTTNIVLLEAVLNSKGYNIETALSAKEAFSIISKTPPNLILLDLLMPKMNGFDFLKEIKSNSQTSSIPIVVISALTDDENVQKALELGAVEFVRKPVDIQNVIQLVKNILQ